VDHHGSVTPTTQLPTGTATYIGGYNGIAVDGTGKVDVQTGASGLSANFGAGSVTGIVTGLSNVNGPVATPAGYGISMTGTITGSTYTGSAALTGEGTSTTQSSLNGAFYGTNAAETAGALAIRGNVNGTSIVTSGGFGGRTQ
jgi:hypothetical protein